MADVTIFSKMTFLEYVTRNLDDVQETISFTPIFCILPSHGGVLIFLP